MKTKTIKIFLKVMEVKKKTPLKRKNHPYSMFDASNFIHLVYEGFV